MVMGEESYLSGEAQFATQYRLPGAQVQLIEQVVATGTPSLGGSWQGGL